MQSGCAALTSCRYPDSSLQHKVPRGTVTSHTLTTGKVYPGTTYESWVVRPGAV